MDSIYKIKEDLTTCHSGMIKPDATVTNFIDEARDRYVGGFVVCRLYHSVLIGRVAADGLEFYLNIKPDYERDLDQIRLFNGEGELFIWRDGAGVFRYRVREDGFGNKREEYVEAKQILWGTHASNPEPGWVEIFEDRGIRLTLPVDNSSTVGKEARKLDKRYALKTRSYIEYNEIGQAGYADCRFVAIGLEG